VALSAEDEQSVASLPWSRASHQRDAYLVREGDRTKSCTLLLHGFAFGQKLLSSGARQITAVQIAGQFLAFENSLLELADHNVQSLGRSTVAKVPKADLLQLMDERPAVRRAMSMDSFIDGSVLREWVVNTGRRDARGRIAHLLCELSARMKAAGIATGPSCEFPLTQEQIGDSTGLTPVHTNRTLQSLRKDGLIELARGRLTILDWHELAHVADFNHRYLHHSC
jgi:CRP-like cAMP-binding protein